MDLAGWKMNVKPGDIAKFVGTPRSDGKMCYVEGPASGPVYDWIVELLEPTFITDVKGFVRKEAGGKAWCGDKYLRRVEPPSDPADETAFTPKDILIPS